MNQQLLSFIGVSHESLTQVCCICSSHGLSCKLTGAGGGGCAFAIVRPGKAYMYTWCVLLYKYKYKYWIYLKIHNLNT